MVVRTRIMPSAGRRGGVSSLLDVVNRKVIAKAVFPGCRYGSLLEDILCNVNATFPANKTEDEVTEKDRKLSKEEEKAEKAKKKEEIDGAEKRRRIKEKYRKAKRESLDDVQKALRETLVQKVREMRRDASRSDLKEEEIELEVDAMRRIVGSGAAEWVTELVKLWGVPGEVGRIPEVAARIHFSVERVYTELIAGKSHDERMFGLMGGTETEGVKRESLEMLIKILLARHRSRLYRENLDAAVETVLFTINPEGFARSYTVREFKEVELCKALRAFERDGAFDWALEALEPRRFASLTDDLKTITKYQGGTAQVRKGISGETLCRYFEERELLTSRAARALMSRHGTGEGGAFLIRDFVRMYLALTDCSSLTGIRYWFAVLDYDFDGAIGASDVAHFYSERRAAGEQTSAVILSDVMSLWTRLCASARIDFQGRGIRLRDLKRMNANDREFILCALLIRRVDDSTLVNVAATLAEKAETPNISAVVVT